MTPTELLDFIRQKLPTEFTLMQTGGYATAHPELLPEEKAFICHYTDTGSTQINRLLHANQGQPTDELTRQLITAVQKMPVYEGSAYSAAHLSPAELEPLRAAAAMGDSLQTAGTLRWPAFLSATRSLRIAKRHLNYTAPPTPHNCLFLLSSRRGRAIELLSKYGPNGRDPSDGEQEILFLPNTTFQVVGLDFTTACPQIELIER